MAIGFPSSVLQLPTSLRCQLLFRNALVHPKQPLVKRIGARKFGLASRVLKESKPVPPIYTNKRPPPAVQKGTRLQPVADPLAAQIAQPLNEPILLYLAPKHGSLYFLSYTLGAFLFFGAYQYVSIFAMDHSDEEPKPWYAKTLGSVIGIFLAAFSTTMFLTPINLIKSVSIIPSAGGLSKATRLLRFEIRKPFPFQAPKIIDVAPSKTVMDKNVSNGIGGLEFYNIAAADAKQFTAEYRSGGSTTTTRGKGIRGRISSMNRSFLEAWPVLKRNTGKMFLRQHIAYVKVERIGNYKLDLQHSLLLDLGKPLAKAIRTDENARTSVLSRLMEFFTRA